jgi:hypothetical protein
MAVAGRRSLVGLPPGTWSVACVDPGGQRMGTVGFEVVDPDHLWVPAELSCPPADEIVRIDQAVPPPAWFDDILSKVLAQQPSDEVGPPGYPRSVRASMLPAQENVASDGRVVGMFDIWPAQIDSDGTP